MARSQVIRIAVFVKQHPKIGAALGHLLLAVFIDVKSIFADIVFLVLFGVYFYAVFIRIGPVVVLIELVDRDFFIAYVVTAV